MGSNISTKATYHFDFYSFWLKFSLKDVWIALGHGFAIQEFLILIFARVTAKMNKL